MKPLTRSELETKAVKLEVKALDEAGVFEGYASTFGNEDQGQDIVVKGAFVNSLRQRGVRGIKLLHEHDCTKPVGIWEDLREDDRGLLARGRLLISDLEKAREVHAMMKHGILDGLSIGFRVVKSETSRGSEAVRLLQEVDLREISTVIFPMNEEAVISAVKSIDDLPLDIAFIREFERQLQRDAGLSRSKACEVVAGYKSLIKAQRDAGGEKVAVSKQPDVAWSDPFVEHMRRLADVARS